MAGIPTEEMPVEKPAEETDRAVPPGSRSRRLGGRDSSRAGSPTWRITSPATTPIEEIPPEAPFEETPQPFTVEDDTAAWLKGMAAGQNIQPEELQPAPPVSSEEIPTEKPVEETHEPFTSEMEPGALKEDSITTGQKPTVEELPPVSMEKGEAQPEWMQTPAQEPIAPEKAPTPAVPSATPEEDITITSWLNKHDVEAALGKTRSTSQEAPSEGIT